MKVKFLDILFGVALLGYVLFLFPDQRRAIGVPKAAPATASAPESSVSRPASVGATAAGDAPDAPPDVPAEEWRQIKAVMSATPEGRNDLARVGEYLTYKHRAAKWQQLQATGADAAARAELAAYLLDSMPVHVARREMTAFEAQSLTTALLQDRFNDPAQLRQAVRAQLQKVKDAQPAPDAQAEQQLAMAAYRQKEAAIVAQWQATPEAQRDQQWLESRLEEARLATLGSVVTR